tara:strand:+ start:146 stop:622 length:477 start_codon:yes stop_codon:yes gene_type:complete
MPTPLTPTLTLKELESIPQFDGLEAKRRALENCYDRALGDDEPIDLGTLMEETEWGLEETYDVLVHLEEWDTLDELRRRAQARNPTRHIPSTAEEHGPAYVMWLYCEHPDLRTTQSGVRTQTSWDTVGRHALTEERAQWRDIAELFTKYGIHHLFGWP